MRQRPRVIAHCEALQAMLSPPNDRLQLMRDVVYEYDPAGATEKGSALFATLLERMKANIQAQANPKLEAQLATVLAERIELLRYRRAEEERAKLVTELRALLQERPAARVQYAEQILREYRPAPVP